MSLTCGVCISDYNEAAHAPFLLPCGHTLCKSCATSPKLIACPFDRSELPANRAALRKNFAFAELVDARNTPVHAALAGFNLEDLAVQPDDLVISDTTLGAGGCGVVKRATLRGRGQARLEIKRVLA